MSLYTSTKAGPAYPLFTMAVPSALKSHWPFPGIFNEREAAEPVVWDHHETSAETAGTAEEDRSGADSWSCKAGSFCILLKVLFEGFYLGF